MLPWPETQQDVHRMGTSMRPQDIALQRVERLAWIVP
jgi:hypothetical protein